MINPGVDNLKVKINLYLIAVALLSLFFSNRIFSQNNILFSVENRIKFGNALFCEEDYLRAIDEYIEALKEVNNDSLRFKIAYSLMKMGRYNEADDYYKGLFFNSELDEEAKFGFYQSNFFRKDYKAYRDLVASERFMPESRKLDVYRLYYVTQYLQEDLLPDTNEVKKVFANEYHQPLMTLYDNKANPEYKSPWTAAILSTVLPGSGKVYTGNYVDGFFSFILNGLFIWLAYDNFDNGRNGRGVLMSLIGGFLYAGNIYGSAASAQNYNAGIRFDFNNAIDLFFKENNYFIPKHNYCNW